MSDMVQKLENEKPNEDQKFARCTLEWFQKNVPEGIGGSRTWSAVAWDKNGPTVLQVTSPGGNGLANKIQVWHRISVMGKGNGMFEKRLEYPEGMDEDDGGMD